MKTIIIVSEDIYLETSVLEIDKEEWNNEDQKYYTNTISGNKKVYVFCSDNHDNISSVITREAQKRDEEEMIVVEHEDSVDREGLAVPDESIEGFNHQEGDYIFSKGVEPVVENPCKSTFDNLFKIVKKNEIESEESSSEKADGVKLSNVRHEITSQFISIQLDMQAVLINSHSKSRIKCAKSIIKDYIKNNTFPCSINLAKALYYITGQKYSVNGYDLEVNTASNLLDVTLKEYVLSDKIAKDKYNAILKKCPVVKEGDNISAALRSDACVVKFFNCIDEAVDDDSPNDLVKVAVDGVDQCSRVSLDNMDQGNHSPGQENFSGDEHVEGYNAKDFCDWFNALSRSVSDFRMD